MVLVAGDLRKSPDSISLPSRALTVSLGLISLLDDLEMVEGCEPAVCIIRSSELCLTAA
jgi:hypothetical protein